ncbi:MAG: hypothetical protein K2O34_06940 [Acetatifactor sp.]|nr:hypothetical protein [Acetatifactor sp.]
MFCERMSKKSLSDFKQLLTQEGTFRDFLLSNVKMENIFSVSSGDGNMQPNIYVISLLQDAGTDVSADAFSAEEAYTVWNKPLEEYSVSEGLLLIIVTLAVVAFIWGVVKGGFSWLGW